jgi:hypothetical protein
MVLPPLAILLLATVDYARFAVGCCKLAVCAENGALYACDPSTQSQSPYANVTAAAQADGAGMSPLPTIDVKYDASYNGSFTSATGVFPGYVQVKASWTFTTLFSYPGIPHTTNLTRFVRMRMLSSS